MTDEEIKEAIEHRDVLIAIKEIGKSVHGKIFIGYLFRQLEVTEVSPLGLTGDILMDKLGFLRAGNAIFKLVAEADPKLAGDLIAENERNRNAKFYIDGGS